MGIYFPRDRDLVIIDGKMDGAKTGHCLKERKRRVRG